VPLRQEPSILDLVPAPGRPYARAVWRRRRRLRAPWPPNSSAGQAADATPIRAGALPARRHQFGDRSHGETRPGWGEVSSGHPQHGQVALGSAEVGDQESQTCQQRGARPGRQAAAEPKGGDLHFQTTGTSTGQVATLTAPAPDLDLLLVLGAQHHPARAWRTRGRSVVAPPTDRVGCRLAAKQQINGCMHSSSTHNRPARAARLRSRAGAAGPYRDCRWHR
jgi:hypothetical protein